MSPRSVATAVLSALLLASCSAPLLNAGLSRLAGATGTAAVQPAPDAPAIWVTLPQRGVKFAMSLLQRDEAVSIWAAQDGTQVVLRHGVLIQTRGFGRDLMSAEAPSIAALTSGIAHQRNYFDLDGTDTTIRHIFNCTMQTGEKASELPGTRHLIEACASEIGSIKNEFWIDSSGTVRKSRQWVSQGVGYAAVDRKDN